MFAQSCDCVSEQVRGALRWLAAFHKLRHPKWARQKNSAVCCHDDSSPISSQFEKNITAPACQRDSLTLGWKGVDG
jgi:hypothetical protein